eukprot:5299968-Pyramimonas_sp.AAC.1
MIPLGSSLRCTCTNSGLRELAVLNRCATTTTVGVERLNGKRLEHATRARVVRTNAVRGNRHVVKMVAAGVPMQRNTRLNVPDLGLSKRSVKQEEGVAEDWVLDFMGMMMKANFPGEPALSVR